MTHKLSTLAAIATLLFTANAMAQNPPQGGERQAQQQISAEQQAEQLTSQMSERLKLDEKQKKSIEKINLTFARSIKANTPGAAGGRSAGMSGRPGGGAMRTGGGGGANMEGGGGPGMGGGMGGGIASPGGAFGNAPTQKTPADMQKAREQAAESRSKKLEKILTPEQFKEWSAMEQERVKAEQERMPRRTEGAPQRSTQGGQRPTPPQRQ